MTKRQRQKSQSVTGPKDSKKKLKTEDIHTQRNDPDHRGIHEDAIRVGRAPTSASTCVACDKRIEKDSPRWGLKYGGNPLTIPVLPLYGSNPMVLWCHPACGLSYVRYSDLPSEAAAARTCHACQDSPIMVKMIQRARFASCVVGRPNNEKSDSTPFIFLVGYEQFKLVTHR
jgi:hypothetical protein